MWIMNHNFDVIIIGAGLSGIALAIELISRTEKSLLIVEKKVKLKKDKNWCFWNEPKNHFSDLFDNKWDEIVVKAKGEQLIKKASNRSYLRISSKKFYDEGLRIINKSKKARLILGQHIDSINELNDKVKVVSKKGTFYCKILFNSVPNEISRNRLKQHFFGIEVKSKKPIFDKSKIILMDFQGKKNTVHFFYLLPYTEYKALVETTYFSSSLCSALTYKKDIRNYLKKNFPNQDFEICFCEKGVLPMYSNTIVRSKKVVPIGMSNNWLKISTGYGFQKAFINSKQIVDCILEGKDIYLEKKLVSTILDQIFCEFLLKYPNDSEEFFFKFFSGLKLKTIINFLTEKYSFIDMVRVLLTLPKKKLILTSISMLWRKKYHVN